MQVYLLSEESDTIKTALVDSHTKCEDLYIIASDEYGIPASEVELFFEGSDIELKDPLHESDLEPDSRLVVRPSEQLMAQRKVKKLNIKMCFAQIVSMALHGDMPGLELIMKAGAGQFVTRTCEESTCVKAAVEGGNIEAVKYFIQLGYSINTTPLLPGTPIGEAALQGNREMISYLLEHGADINAKNENGQTALMMLAIHDRYLTVIKDLIEKGADIHQTSRNHQTLLMVSSYYGSEQVCQLLLDLQMDTNETDSCGNTALTFALEKNHIHIAELLSRHPATDLSIKNTSGMNILHEATQSRAIDFLTVLLVYAGDINDKKYLSQYGESLLTAAIHTGSVEIVELYLSCGADVTAEPVSPSQLAENLHFSEISEMLAHHERMQLS
eukprot:TRINITY_DN4929_c0_g2_i1.p1 TRINITY_DN4929_c0_g2~~TRINITY_DN4929_c0_g2_i1.p1  ORF type:complete len:386 (+),score=75.06 TRINITY_DN4929_c0_g2_i1:46-1203(+)